MLLDRSADSEDAAAGESAAPFDAERSTTGKTQTARPVGAASCPEATVAASVTMKIAWRIGLGAGIAVITQQV
jgi:hypothetical protein